MMATVENLGLSASFVGQANFFREQSVDASAGAGLRPLSDNNIPYFDY
jgi:hypothetical protein